MQPLSVPCHHCCAQESLRRLQRALAAQQQPQRVQCRVMQQHALALQGRWQKHWLLLGHCLARAHLRCRPSC